jgi:hypothetical protein
MEKGETLMFSRLHLSGNDIVRKAGPRFMDGEPGSWITLDFEDIVGPQYPRTSNATFTRLPVQRPVNNISARVVIGYSRTLCDRGPGVLV